MHARRHTARAFLAAALALPLAACGGIVDQIEASDVAIAALIKVPDQQVPDPAHPGQMKTIPGLVTFQLFFGHLDKSKLTSGSDGKQTASAGAFGPNADAQVQLDFMDPVKGATTISVGKTDATGFASKQSSDTERLVYVEGEYTLSIAYSGKTYKLKVTAGKPTQMVEFKDAPDKLIKDWDVSAHPDGFTVTRVGGDADPAKNDIAFVKCAGVTDTSAEYSNFPSTTDPLAFLKLVLDDTEWRAKSFTIPVSTFKATNGYVVALTGVAKGTQDPTGAALFLGSTFLAGVADGGALQTK